MPSLQEDASRRVYRYNRSPINQVNRIDTAHIFCFFSEISEAAARTQPQVLAGGGLRGLGRATDAPRQQVRQDRRRLASDRCGRGSKQVAKISSVIPAYCKRGDII